MVDSCVHGAIDSATVIAATKKLVDDAGMNSQIGAPEAYVCSFDFTVAAAKHLVKATAVDNGGHTCGCCCVATTEHTTYGVQTIVDGDCTLER